MTSPEQIRLQRRRRWAGVCLLGALATATIAVVAPTAQAAPDPAGADGGFARIAPGPTTTSNDKLSLAVNPGGDISQANAVMTVAGAGYDPSTPLYVAVCAADTDPAKLDTCIGGAVPDGNKSKAWAYISDSGQPAAQGGVGGKWSANGTFSVILSLPATDKLNCAEVGCAVFTHQDNGSGGDLSLAVGFIASTSSSVPTTSSAPPTTSSSSTTSSARPTPTTVEPETIRAATIQAGSEQQVLFAGFAPKEKVSVTLFSDPIKLPDVTADDRGLVKITFKVPADLPAGTHLLQAVGGTSLVTGIARFTVTAPPPTSSSTPSPPPPTTTSSAASSSAAVVVPTTSSSQVVSSASSASSALIVPPVTPASQSARPVWPWFGLGAILLIALGLVVWLMVRSRRQQLDRENAQRERLLAEAAAANAAREAAYQQNPDETPTTYLGGPATPGAGEYGLLSGRDHPDNPGLLSGHGEPEPDERPTTSLGPATAPSPVGEAEPEPDRGEHDWLPGFGPAETGPATGPGTEQWRPDFTDGDDPNPPSGRHRS